QTSSAIRLGPFTASELEARYAQPVGSGSLFDQGRKVITYLSAPARGQFLVRTGMGATSTAKVSGYDADAGLAGLEVENPVPHGANAEIAAKTPFPGAMIYVAGFPRSTVDKASWPQMRVDVLGTPPGELRLGYPLHVQDIAAGSGVFDQQGRLIGVVG